MKFKIKLPPTEQQEIEARKMGRQLIVVGQDGSPIEWEIISQTGGEIVLAHGSSGRQLRIAGTKRGEKRHLWVNGRSLRYQRIDEAAGSGSAEAAGSLSASIPAVVTELLVAVGDTVSAGDKLILLESMKMVIPIVAPTAGNVAEIRCAAGDSVQPGVPLIQIANDE